MNKLRTTFANLKADSSRWGWNRSLIGRIVKRLARILGVRVYVVRANTMVDNPEYPAKQAGVDYRTIQSDELLKATSDPQLDLSREFVEAAIIRGDVAFGAFDGVLLVSYMWRAFSAAPHTSNLWVRVKKPYCYSYKSYTRPSYRGRHISPSVFLFSDVEILKRGYTYRAGFVEIVNWASLAMGKRMGSQYLGYVGYAKWFNRYFLFRTRAVKAIGFEIIEHVPS